MASTNQRNVDSMLCFAQLLARVAPTAQIKIKSEATATQPLSSAVGLQRMPHRIQGEQAVVAPLAEFETRDMVGPSTNASQPSTRAGSPSGSSSTSISSSRQQLGVQTKLQDRCCAATLDDLGTDSEFDEPDNASATPESSVVSLSSCKSTPLCTPTSVDLIMGTSPGARPTQAITVVTGDASQRTAAGKPFSSQKVDPCPSSSLCSSREPIPHEVCLQQQTIRNSTKIDCSIMRTSPVQKPVAMGKATFIDASLRSPVGSLVSSNPPASCRSSTKPTQDASHRTPGCTTRRPALMYKEDTQPTQDASHRGPISGTSLSPSACSIQLDTMLIQDASQRSPISATTITSPSETRCDTDALTSWLWGVNEPLPNGEELAERLRAVAPEMYED